VLGANGEKRLDPRKLIERGFISSRCKAPPVITSKEYLKNNHEFNKVITEASKKSGADVIDPLDQLSPGGVWIVADKKGPIRVDEGHLRPSYVRDHVKYLDGTVAP